jgi:hypothetical protein
VSHELLDAMVGQPCWHLSAGGATAPSFVLVLGGRVPRDVPLSNPAQPDDFRHSRGAVELLVWSSWRLQRGASVLATSDQGEAGLAVLRSLVGAVIESVTCAAPAWDLRIRFADATELVTFSDHLEPGASVAANWELWARARYLRAGPGEALIEEEP